MSCNEKFIEAQQIRSKWQNWNWQSSRKNLLISSPTVNLITYSGKINTINWLKTDKPPRYMVRQVNLWHFCKSTHSFEGTQYKWWQHYRPVMTAKTLRLKCYVYIWKKNKTRAKLIKLSMCNHIHSKQHSANSTNFKFSLVRILIRIKGCSTKNDLYRLEWLQCYRSRLQQNIARIANSLQCPVS